jgi:hypothetical protein
MIMRFPLRVVAIGGVEVGSGKGRVGMLWCYSSGLFWSLLLSIDHSWRACVFCCHYRSSASNLKEYLERKLASLIKKNHGAVDCTIAAVALSGASLEWNTRQGKASKQTHERGVEKAS